MKIIKKIFNIYLLFCFYVLINSYREYQTKPPTNLKRIETIYSSWSSIGIHNKPIITWEYIYYNQGNTLKAFNYQKVFFSIPSVFYPYGQNSFLKPIDSYSLTFDVYTNFFTKDCSLRLHYISDKEFTYNNAILNLQFNELKGSYCYDTLRIFYDTKSGLMAVYNVEYNKILVIELKSIYSHPYYEKNLEVKMKRQIIKSLIYSRNLGEKVLLIGQDYEGNINFWNVKNYCEGIWNNIKCAYNDDLIKSFKFEDSPIEDFMTIIDTNKLFVINGDNFLIFDLDKIELIYNKQRFFIGITSLLGLVDGNALLGTYNGILFLIKYQNTEIVVLDKREICPNQRIYSLSSISNCTPGTYFCYIIAANCDGYLKIFEIKHSQSGKNSEL